LSSALVVIGGIGRDAALRAATIAVSEAQPVLLVSAGLAGALTANLKAGNVVLVREVVDDATGERFTTEEGDAVLVTASRVVGKNDKQRLASAYKASAVDMEAAAVARVAKQSGIAFAAAKAISDELDFAMPPLNQFVDSEGKLHELAFVAYVAVRPRWWSSTIKLASNSRMASKNLAAALEHLIQQSAISRAGARSIRS
jgi:adenosylhomocysteine nucleosidase